MAYEKLTIQAGTYWAYKFESNGWVGNSRFEDTYWHIPDWGIRLKSITKFYPYRGAATLETTELVSFSRGNKVTTLPDEGQVRVSSR